MPMKLTDHDAMLQALDFTKLAIEHNLIPLSADAKKAATNVYDFCNTLYNEFSESNKVN